MDADKQLKQVLLAVIKTILDLFKIHGKVVFGNPSVIIQDMFSKTPESFNAVNVVFGVPVNKFLVVAQGVVFAQALQGIVAPESVGVVNSSFSSLLPYDRHQFLFGDVLHHPRINLAVPFQKPKYDVFASRAPSPLALPPAAEVALVHLHLAVQFAALKLGHVVDHLAQTLIEAGDRLVVKAKVVSETISRLLLIKASHNGNLGSDSSQGFLPAAAFVSTSDIPSGGLVYLKGTAENALSALQKVGRTAENILSSLHHMDILVPYGYETH